MSNNKMATKADLQELYQRILPYLGGMPEVLANKFSKGDMYSTDEKMIGQWIDGKPLYQKSVNFGALPNNTTKSVAHEISNIDFIADYSCVASNGTVFMSIPKSVPSEGNAGGIGINCTKTNVEITTSTNRSSYTTTYAILKYTKTTDSPISIGNDTDYSTDEKIIGTWIDGGPVYEIVLQPASDISITTSWTNLHNVSTLHIDKLIFADIHRYPNQGKENAIIDFESGYIRAKLTSGSETYYTNGFTIIQYTKTS